MKKLFLALAATLILTAPARAQTLVSGIFSKTCAAGDFFSALAGTGVLTCSTPASGSGTVTSVGLGVPASSLFGVSGSPVTTSGTLALTTTGTSGGIPYFDTTSTLNTSALLTNHALIIGAGAGAAPKTLAAATNGQIVIGSTGADPVPATPTSSGATITVSAGAGSLNLEANATTINGTTCTPGGSCTVSSSASALVVGTTAITSGTTNGLLYDNAGVLGNLATGNNSLLVTNGSGVPSIGTAIPSGVTATTQTAGDNTTQLATDAFVQAALAGVNPAVAVQAATTAAADTSGFTYFNGVSGVGATFTGTANTPITIDGFTFTALGQRLLVKNDTQSPSGAFNGVYYVTQVQTSLLAPILTRALDYDMPSDINNTGAIPVVNGTANALTSWLLTSSVNTVGTDPLTYSQLSNGNSGTVNSGTSTHLAYYAASTNAVSSAPNATISAGALSLGASGTAGSVAMGNATSGTVTLQPVTGALGTVTASLPANTGTVAELNLAQTWSALQIYGASDLGLIDSSAAHNVLFTATSSTALTADRTLTWDVVDGSRILKLGSNLTIATDPGAVTGALKSNGSGTFAKAASTDLSNSSNIALLNTAQSYTAAQRGTPTNIGISTATFTPNFNTGQNFEVDLTSACPCTLANPSTTLVAGQSGVIEIHQDGSGSRTIGTWGSDYQYVGGTSTITLSTSPSAVDYLSYYVNNAATGIVFGSILKAPAH